jgi:hypothetical protein
MLEYKKTIKFDSRGQMALELSYSYSGTFFYEFFGTNSSEEFN